MGAPIQQTEADVVIDVRDLSKQYPGDRVGLGGVSFSVRRGEVFCLLGRPGAGKSTALDLVAGFKQPTSGRILILGNDVSRSPLARKRAIAYVNGAAIWHGLYGASSPERNLEFFCSLRQGTLASRTQRLNALRRMGVPERCFDLPVSSLPRSASFATSLAVALLQSTPVLVFDEPTAGLDSRAVADFDESLQEFQRNGTAVLIATTDVILAGRLADRTAILKEARIVVERDRRQMLGQSVAELYVDYVGRPVPHAFSAAPPSVTGQP